MKEYSTLKISEDFYELHDEKGLVFIKSDLPRHVYIYEESIPLNILSKKGWDVVYKMQENWFMMSKNTE